MKTTRRRMQRVESALDELPLREDVVREAYEVFQLDGDLPDNERLAKAVVDAAIQGELRFEDQPALVRLIAGSAAEALERPWGLREHLLDHAGYAPPGLREAARLACRYLVAKGGDLTDLAFLAHEPLPPHQSIGMHVLGYPERLAKPPYEAQARRLFARYETLRENVPAGEEWHDASVDAAVAFAETGRLPADELMRDAVLADAELAALIAHARGRDVSARMQLFDRIARCKGQRRLQAIADLQALHAQAAAQTPEVP